MLLTSSGRMVDVANITPDDICLKDIAHSLARQCRFGGHSFRFYSVAQHSIRVAMALPHELRLAGLLHDAAEAYVLDLPRPVKGLFPDYQELCHKVEAAVRTRYGLGDEWHPMVKEMDDRMLATEMVELFPDGQAWAAKLLPGIKLLPHSLTVMPPEEAELAFFATFARTINLPKQTHYPSSALH